MAEQLQEYQQNTVPLEVQQKAYQILAERMTSLGMETPNLLSFYAMSQVNPPRAFYSQSLRPMSRGEYNPYGNRAIISRDLHDPSEALAHEYTHAMQFMAGHGNSVPPGLTLNPDAGDVVVGYRPQERGRELLPFLLSGHGAGETIVQNPALLRLAILSTWGRDPQGNRLFREGEQERQAQRAGPWNVMRDWRGWTTPTLYGEYEKKKYGFKDTP